MGKWPLFGAVTGALLLLGIGGFAWSKAADGKARSRALSEVRTPLVALKVAIRDGVSLYDLRKARHSLATAVELNKEHFNPTNLSRVNTWLDIAELAWPPAPNVEFRIAYEELERLDRQLGH